MVLGLMLIVTGTGSYKTYQKLQEKDREIKRLESLIEKEEERTKEIQELEVYMQTDDYIKNTAREKLGLTEPGEILIRKEGK